MTININMELTTSLAIAKELDISHDEVMKTSEMYLTKLGLDPDPYLVPASRGSVEMYRMPTKYAFYIVAMYDPDTILKLAEFGIHTNKQLRATNDMIESSKLIDSTGNDGFWILAGTAVVITLVICVTVLMN